MFWRQVRAVDPFSSVYIQLCRNIFSNGQSPGGNLIAGNLPWVINWGQSSKGQFVGGNSPGVIFQGTIHRVPALCYHDIIFLCPSCSQSIYILVFSPCWNLNASSTAFRQFSTLLFFYIQDMTYHKHLFFSTSKSSTFITLQISIFTHVVYYYAQTIIKESQSKEV